MEKKEAKKKAEKTVKKPEVKKPQVKKPEVNKDEITRREERKYVAIPMTKPEIEKTVESLFSKMRELETIENDFHSVQQDFKDQMDGVSGEIKRLRDEYESKKKQVERVVIIEFHWKAMKKVTIEKATKKIIITEKITDDDLQQKLPLGIPPETKKPETKKPDEKKTEEKKTDAKAEKRIEDPPAPPVEKKEDKPAGKEYTQMVEQSGDCVKIVNCITDLSFEIKNGDNYAEVPFVGLKEGNVFRVLRAGKLITLLGRGEFKAISYPERDKDLSGKSSGFWKIAVA